MIFSCFSYITHKNRKTNDGIMEQRILNLNSRFAPAVATNPFPVNDSSAYQAYLAMRRTRDSSQERLFFLFIVIIEHYVNGLDINDIGDLNEPNIILAANGTNQAEVDARNASNAKRAEIRGFMILNKPIVARYVLDLVAAYQQTRINSDHVESYQAAAGGDFPDVGDLMEILPSAASRMPKIVASDALRGLLSDINWVRYHTAASSIPTLMAQYADAIPKKCVHILSLETRYLITAAAKAPHNMDLSDRIPKLDLAKASIYFESYRPEVTNWHAGIKAVKAQPTSVIVHWRKIMKQI
jgi:hypothetical protein